MRFSLCSGELYFAVGEVSHSLGGDNMQHSAIHDPRSNFTASQRKGADIRRDRLARIAANAHVDVPLSCPSASQRATVQAAADLVRAQQPAPSARRAVTSTEAPQP